MKKKYLQRNSVSNSKTVECYSNNSVKPVESPKKKLIGDSGLVHENGRKVQNRSTLSVDDQSAFYFDDEISLPPGRTHSDVISTSDFKPVLKTRTSDDHSSSYNYLDGSKSFRSNTENDHSHSKADKSFQSNMGNNRYFRSNVETFSNSWHKFVGSLFNKQEEGSSYLMLQNILCSQKDILSRFQPSGVAQNDTEISRVVISAFHNFIESVSTCFGIESTRIFDIDKNSYFPKNEAMKSQLSSKDSIFLSLNCNRSGQKISHETSTFDSVESQPDLSKFYYEKLEEETRSASVLEAVTADVSSLALEKGHRGKHLTSKDGPLLNINCSDRHKRCYY